MTEDTPHAMDAPERREAADFVAAVERLLRRGSNVSAFDTAQEGLEACGPDPRLIRIQALALKRSGATRRAHDALQRLVDDGHRDPETLGLLAGTLKDLALQTAEGPRQRELLQRAFEAYRTTYRGPDADYWHGINAATLAVVLGQEAQARDLATAVRAQCRALEAAPGADGERPEALWLLATLGEASLVLADVDAAVRFYAEAARVGRERTADLASALRNARLVCDHHPALGDEVRVAVEEALGLPPVYVVAGHMVDQPGRATPRFPADLLPAVEAAIARELGRSPRGIVYASAACGSDLLFLAEAQRLGFETSVILPYEREQFVLDSVDVVPGQDWRARFDRVLDAAAEVAVVSSSRLPWGSASYEYANRIQLGLARLHARALGVPLRPLAVWDGAPGDGPGGTASMVAAWREVGLEPQVIDLARIVAAADRPVEAAAAVGHPVRRAPESEPTFPSEVRAMLFADVRGFSQLTEPQIPTFVREVLGSVAGLLRGFHAPPRVRNTWGDALYLVFDGVREAGLFALELAQRIGALDREALKLPDTLDFRIALHAGPVYAFSDPVTEVATYGGTHVSHAARIEPITPPGEVYASRWFAALAAAEGVSEFVCEYVGRTPLAKGYGTYPTYHVRRPV